tara:strand:+ start:25893 stop:27326 length:1434 start_codon:yes stop_codon:yes gene_type:complete
MSFEDVILINPFPQSASGINEATIYPPIGLAYLASVLRNSNIKVKIIDANLMKLTSNQVLEMLVSENPDLIGISLNIITGKAGIDLARLIKERIKSKVCLGGPLVSTNSEKILEISQADIAVIGEGENTLLEICKRKKFSKIKGIVWKSEDGCINNNGLPDLIDNLDTIPIPAYDLLPPFIKYHSMARKVPIGTIITSRGCPYNCSFCNHNIFGKKFRAFSPEYVIEEIKLLITQYGIKQLDILDDNFTLDIKRADRILDLIIENKFNLLINLQNGVRADRLTQSIVKKMKKAGVFKAGIGIETGSMQIMRDIEKDLDLHKASQAVDWFRKEGIITIGFFIIGFPTDTREIIEETINFAIKINPSIANFCILIPFPGTEIYFYMKRKNLLNENVDIGITTGFYQSKLYHRCLHLSYKEVYHLQTRAYRKFNFRIHKIVEILFQIRSVSELRWLVEASVQVIQNLFIKNKNNGQGQTR